MISPTPMTQNSTTQTFKPLNQEQKAFRIPRRQCSRLLLACKTA